MSYKNVYNTKYDEAFKSSKEEDLQDKIPQAAAAAALAAFRSLNPSEEVLTQSHDLNAATEAERAARKEYENTSNAESAKQAGLVALEKEFEKNTNSSIRLATGARRKSRRVKKRHASRRAKRRTRRSKS